MLGNWNVLTKNTILAIFEAVENLLWFQIKSRNGFILQYKYLAFENIFISFGPAYLIFVRMNFSNVYGKTKYMWTKYQAINHFRIWKLTARHPDLIEQFFTTSDIKQFSRTRIVWACVTYKSLLSCEIDLLLFAEVLITQVYKINFFDNNQKQLEKPCPE